MATIETRAPNNRGHLRLQDGEGGYMQPGIAVVHRRQCLCRRLDPSMANGILLGNRCKHHVPLVLGGGSADAMLVQNRLWYEQGLKTAVK